MDVSTIHALQLSPLLTHQLRMVESNLLVICCCLPTLRRFLRHVAPRVIGEYSSGPSGKTGNSRKLRTWGSTKSGPRRPFDTLMNTADDRADDRDIPLETRDHSTKSGQRKTMKGDNDSEEAILYERTVQVTYESAESRTGNPGAHSGKIWAT
jgi:hypothetical protein